MELLGPPENQKGQETSDRQTCVLATTDFAAISATAYNLSYKFRVSLDSKELAPPILPTT